MTYDSVNNVRGGRVKSWTRVAHPERSREGRRRDDREKLRKSTAGPPQYVENIFEKIMSNTAAERWLSEK